MKLCRHQKWWKSSDCKKHWCGCSQHARSKNLTAVLQEVISKSVCGVFGRIKDSNECIGLLRSTTSMTGWKSSWLQLHVPAHEKHGCKEMINLLLKSEEKSTKLVCHMVSKPLYLTPKTLHLFHCFDTVHCLLSTSLSQIDILKLKLFSLLACQNFLHMTVNSESESSPSWKKNEEKCIKASFSAMKKFAKIQVWKCVN